jgi:hypothetical protein
MPTMTQTVPPAKRALAQPVRLRTTLYDLIAAINEEAGADEEEAVVATLMYMLQKCRVTCTDGVKTYRLVGNNTAHPSLAGT